MRVIAGQFKGRRLAGPEGPGLRPTSDSLRETLFNILGEATEGARVLDAFAGTGAVGIEAISRGAAQVTFVERDRRAIRLLQENIRRCGAEDACAIVERDFFHAFPPPRTPEPQNLGTPEPQNPRTPNTTFFNLVFLDPPYDEKDLELVMRAAVSVTAPGGWIVLEHSRRRASPESIAPVRRTRLLTAGDSALSFYQ
jgi:16S rRNA (guanine966-N2)-methyltransferase